jgi:hypothetical protein
MYIQKKKTKEKMEEVITSKYGVRYLKICEISKKKNEDHTGCLTEYGICIFKPCIIQTLNISLRVFKKKCQKTPDVHWINVGRFQRFSNCSCTYYD